MRSKTAMMNFVSLITLIALVLSANAAEHPSEKSGKLSKRTKSGKAGAKKPVLLKKQREETDTFEEESSFLSSASLSHASLSSASKIPNGELLSDAGLFGVPEMAPAKKAMKKKVIASKKSKPVSKGGRKAGRKSAKAGRKDSKDGFLPSLPENQEPMDPLSPASEASTDEPSVAPVLKPKAKRVPVKSKPMPPIPQVGTPFFDFSRDVFIAYPGSTFFFDFIRELEHAHRGFEGLIVFVTALKYTLFPLNAHSQLGGSFAMPLISQKVLYRDRMEKIEKKRFLFPRVTAGRYTVLLNFTYLISRKETETITSLEEAEKLEASGQLFEVSGSRTVPMNFYCEEMHVELSDSDRYFYPGSEVHFTVRQLLPASQYDDGLKRVRLLLLHLPGPDSLEPHLYNETIIDLADGLVEKVEPSFRKAPERDLTIRIPEIVPLTGPHQIIIVRELPDDACPYANTFPFAPKDDAPQYVLIATSEPFVVIEQPVGSTAKLPTKEQLPPQIKVPVDPWPLYDFIVRRPNALHPIDIRLGSLKVPEKSMRNAFGDAGDLGATSKALLNVRAWPVDDDLFESSLNIISNAAENKKKDPLEGIPIGEGIETCASNTEGAIQRHYEGLAQIRFIPLKQGMYSVISYITDSKINGSLPFSCELVEVSGLQILQPQLNTSWIAGRNNELVLSGWASSTWISLTITIGLHLPFISLHNRRTSECVDGMCVPFMPLASVIVPFRDGLHVPERLEMPFLVSFGGIDPWLSGLAVFTLKVSLTERRDLPLGSSERPTTHTIHAMARFPFTLLNDQDSHQYVNDYKMRESMRIGDALPLAQSIPPALKGFLRKDLMENGLYFMPIHSTEHVCIAFNDKTPVVVGLSAFFNRKLMVQNPKKGETPASDEPA